MRAAAPLLAALLLAGCFGPRHAYPDGQGIQGQLEREVIALQQSVRLLELQLATCDVGGRPDPIYSELHQVLGQREVRVERRGLVTIVTLLEGQLFGTDGESLREEARMALDVLGTALSRRPDYTALVEGHTADRPPNPALAQRYPDLLDLAYARANTVRDALIEQFGVKPSQLTLASRGPFLPVADNDTPAGQRQNRRVMIYIYPPEVRR